MKEEKQRIKLLVTLAAIALVSVVSIWAQIISYSKYPCTPYVEGIAADHCPRCDPCVGTYWYPGFDELYEQATCVMPGRTCQIGQHGKNDCWKATWREWETPVIGTCINGYCTEFTGTGGKIVDISLGHSESANPACSE